MPVVKYKIIILRVQKLLDIQRWTEDGIIWKNGRWKSWKYKFFDSDKTFYNFSNIKCKFFQISTSTTNISIFLKINTSICLSASHSQVQEQIKPFTSPNAQIDKTFQVYLRSHYQTIFELESIKQKINPNYRRTTRVEFLNASNFFTLENSPSFQPRWT